MFSFASDRIHGEFNKTLEMRIFDISGTTGTARKKYSGNTLNSRYKLFPKGRLDSFKRVFYVFALKIEKSVSYIHGQ